MYNLLFFGIYLRRMSNEQLGLPTDIANLGGSLPDGTTVGEIPSWTGVSWQPTTLAQLQLPMIFTDMSPVFDPSAPEPAVNEGYLYKKDGFSGLYWYTPGGPELDLTTGGGGASFPLQAPDGTAGTPQYSFVSDTTAGLFMPAVGEIGVATSGAEVMRIDANGNVGFGTQLPLNFGGLYVAPFINKMINSENLTGSNCINITGNSVGGPGAILSLLDLNSPADQKTIALTNSAGNFSMYRLSDLGVPLSNPLTVGTSTGNVSMMTTDSVALAINSGIGGFLMPTMDTATRDLIAAPTAGLQIYNTTTNLFNYYDGVAWVPVGGGAGVTWPLEADASVAAAPAYTFAADTTVGMYEATNGLGFSTAGTERLYIEANGDIGIGTNDASNNGLFNDPGFFSKHVGISAGAGNVTLDLSGSNGGGPTPATSIGFTDLNGPADRKNLRMIWSGGALYFYIFPDIGGAPIYSPLYINANSANEYGITIGSGNDNVMAMNSTVRGFKMPNMTTVQRDAIVGPTVGLLVYNTTTHTIDRYNGASWDAIGGVTNVEDSTFRIMDNLDNTKKLAFECSAISMGTTQTCGVPNGSVSYLVGRSDGGAQSMFATGGVTTPAITTTLFGYNAGGASAHDASVILGNNASATGAATDSVVLGFHALNAGTATRSVVLGRAAAQGAASATDCIILGKEAGGTGALDKNIAIGSYSLLNCGVGANNTAIGYETLISNTVENNNIALGHQAGRSATANGNIFIGTTAGANITADDNICIGASAGRYLSNTDNIVIGKNACDFNPANCASNVFIGTNVAGASQTSANNVCIGYNSGVGLTSGSNSVLLGYQAGSTLSTGTNNICIGLNSNVAAANTTDAIAIGSTAATGQTVLGNAGTTTTCNIHGIYGVTTAGDGVAMYVDSVGKLGTAVSSMRYKRNIVDMKDELLNEVLELNPVTFQWKPEVSTCEKTQYGLIAEQVAEVLPELVVYKDGIPETVQYQNLVPMLLGVVKKLEKRIAILEGSMK